MRSCTVMISTKADGQNSEIVREGEMELFPRAAKIVYHEENALVKVSLQGENAEVIRDGDYSLALFLESGKTTAGKIGIGGNSGEISTVTHAIEYKIAEDFAVVRLRYDLLIGAERQKMELRLLAKVK